MRSRSPVAVLLPLVLCAHGPAQQSDAKLAAVASIDVQRADLVRLSDRIWRYAETALRETRSAQLLADHAEAQGFRVERGVAGMPTAFVASYGEGPPVIGIMGEYDALPGISQKAQSTQEPLEEGAGGHGCGQTCSARRASGRRSRSRG